MLNSPLGGLGALQYKVTKEAFTKWRHNTILEKM